MLRISDSKALDVLGKAEGLIWSSLQKKSAPAASNWAMLLKVWKAYQDFLKETGYAGDEDALKTVAESVGGNPLLAGSGGVAKYQLLHTGELVLLRKSVVASKVVIVEALGIRVI